MKKNLEVGTLMSGAKFSIPLDLVTRTLGIVGIRGAGKTVAATVIAEEMLEAGLPWVALDPVGVWWGLRVNPDGTPGGYPVVVLGGEHADLPLEKHSGPKLAEAILRESISCVIDLSLESKNTWRFFVTEFCNRLMELRPAVQRHVFLEEAPEFVPQRPMGEQKRSLAAVDRLFRLGRNFGYGGTALSQRYATVNKDVLTQCESLLALRMIGKPDRDACRDWIAEVVGATESQKKADKFFDSLSGLPSGCGWWWSPQWLNEFVQIRVRQRKTYHPGATRTVGQAPKQVALSDVRDFVERFRSVLEKPTPMPRVKSFTESGLPVAPTFSQALAEDQDSRMREENASLRAQVADLHRQLGSAKAALDAIRKALEPEYRAMQKLFSEIDSVASTGVDGSIYAPWKEKLGGACARMIDALLSHGQVTRTQLATLTGQSPRSGSFATNLARLNTNGLIEKEGDRIRLRPTP